jgi:hypothetical protein
MECGCESVIGLTRICATRIPSFAVKQLLTINPMKNYSKDDPYIPVATPVIGQKYHLSWAKDPAMVWVLLEIRGVNAYMETPKTKKKLTTQRAALRHTREEQWKIESEELRKKQEGAPAYDF